MREDFWEFEPTHTVFLATNREPSVRGTGPSIWRRIRLIPFSVQMPDDQAKKDMPYLLRKELPASWLGWLGLSRVASRGFDDTPECYQCDEGLPRRRGRLEGAFVATLVIRTAAKVKAGDIYARYKVWSEASGLGTLSMVKFGKAIEERGYRKEKSSLIFYCGIGLKDESRQESPADQKDSRGGLGE